ncbi:hypothetical protein EDD21DRAFT_161402 [Dissophora ornata]|nr:hypothetical protein EDD21DRAFT_161402 [Dissophora ornata]
MGTTTTAAAAFRDDVLFVQYSNPSNNFGTLYAIYPQQQPNGGGVASMYSAHNNSTSNNTNTLVFSAQTILGSNIGSGISGNSSIRSSMVSTSSMDASQQGFRHDLLLSFSSIAATTTPLALVRLVPQPPYIGDGDVRYGRTAWGYVSETQSDMLVSNNVTGLWMVSGNSLGSKSSSSTYSTLEGSAMYELYTDGLGVYAVQKIDVSSEDGMARPISRLLWTRLVGTLDGTASPKMVRFLDGSTYDGVVVGGCAASPQLTCLVFFNDAGTVLVSTTTSFDSTSCLAADSGSIVMVTSAQTWTFNYDAVTSSTVAGTWTAQVTQPSTRSTVLACAAKDQTFYTIQKGEGVVPSISTLDFSNTTTWIWQSPSLVQTSNSNGSGSSGSGHRGVSPTVIAILVIVIAVVVGAAVYLWMRKSKTKSLGLRQTTTIAPGTLVSPAPINNNGTLGAAAVAIPLQTMNQASQSGGGNSPSSGIPISAAYSNRTSLPLQPTGTATSGPPGPGYHIISMPEQRSPLIATSLSAAPYRPFVISSSPIPSSSMISSPIMMTHSQAPGDKYEVDEQDDGRQGQQQGESSTGGSGEHGESSGSSSSLQRSSNILYADEPSRPHRNSRPLQEVLSPTLANAQLILQQSQHHHRHPQ